MRRANRRAAFFKACDVWRNVERSRYLRVFRFNQSYRWCSNDDGDQTETANLPEFDTFIAQILNEDGDTLVEGVTVDGIYNS